MLWSKWYPFSELKYLRGIEPAFTPSTHDRSPPKCTKSLDSVSGRAPTKFYVVSGRQFPYRHSCFSRKNGSVFQPIAVLPLLIGTTRVASNFYLQKRKSLTKRQGSKHQQNIPNFVIVPTGVIRVSFRVATLFCSNSTQFNFFDSFWKRHSRIFPETAQRNLRPFGSLRNSTSEWHSFRSHANDEHCKF